MFLVVRVRDRFSSEASGAAAHDFALADELGVEFGAVEGEEDVKVDACEIGVSN